MRTGKLMILCLLLLLATTAMAADKGIIDLTSVAEVEITVTNAQGKPETKRVEADKANVTPGDAVIFTTHYVNNGTEQASSIVINNPMPENMTYIDGSAEGTATIIVVSADKGKTFGAPGTLKVKDKKGNERPAGPADYTNIRWTLKNPLPPGMKGSVSFKAKVL